jgi:hypothetical protein
MFYDCMIGDVMPYFAANIIKEPKKPNLCGRSPGGGEPR